MLVQDKPLSDAEERVSWRDGVVVFRETSLSDAVAVEFNRYNTRQIYLDDSALGFQCASAVTFARAIPRVFVRFGLQTPFPSASRKTTAELSYIISKRLAARAAGRL